MSAADNGIGSGTDKMVYNRSGGEKSSIGNIDSRVDSKVIRVGVNRLRKAARLLLAGGKYGLRVQMQIFIPLSMQKHVCLASVIPLIFKELVSFHEYVPPLREFLPFGLDPLTDCDPFRRRVQSKTNRETHASWNYTAPPACHTQHRRSDVAVGPPRVSFRSRLGWYLR